MTRSAFARSAEWKRSRVTNVLNGSKNPTFKTLWEFARKLGFEADINFRMPTEAHALQPWQKNTRIIPRAMIDIHYQTAFEVARDIINENHKSHYLSLGIKQAYSPIVKNELLQDTSNKIPVSTANTASYLNTYSKELA